MPLPALQVKKRKRSTSGVSQSAPKIASLSISQGRAQRISAQKAAEDKGFQFKDITDFAKDAGPVVLNAVTDTLSAPQREVGSLLSGDGLVDPYSAEAENYNPSALLKKGPGKVGGVGGFAADVLLDPLNVTGVKVLANVAVKGTAKGAMKALARQAAEHASTPRARVIDRAGNLVRLPRNYAQRSGASSSLLDESKQIGLDIGYRASQAKKPPLKRLASALMLGSGFRKSMEQGAAQVEHKAGTSAPSLTAELGSRSSAQREANKKVIKAQEAVDTTSAELGQLQKQRGEALRQQALQDTGTRQKVELSSNSSVRPFVLRDGKAIKLPRKAAERQGFDKQLLSEGQQNVDRGIETAQKRSAKSVPLSAGSLRDLQAIHGSNLDNPEYVSALEQELTNRLSKAAAGKAAAKDAADSASQMDEASQAASDAASLADERVAAGKLLTQDARQAASDNARSTTFDDMRAVVTYDRKSGQHVIEYKPHRYTVNSAQRTREARRASAGKEPITNQDLVDAAQTARNEAEAENAAKAAYYQHVAGQREYARNLTAVRDAGFELRKSAREAGRTEGRAAGAQASKDQQLIKEYTKTERKRYQKARKAADQSQADLLTADRQLEWATKNGSEADLAKANKVFKERLAAHEKNIAAENAAREAHYAKRDEFLGKAEAAKSKVARGRPGREVSETGGAQLNPGRPHSKLDKLRSRFNTPGKSTADAIFRGDQAAREANRTFLSQLDEVRKGNLDNLKQQEQLRKAWDAQRAAKLNSERALANLEQRRAAQELGGPYTPKRTSAEARAEADKRAAQKSIARKNKQAAKRGARQIRTSLSFGSGSTRTEQEALQELAAIQAYKDGRKASIPGAPKEGKITNLKAELRRRKQVREQAKAERAKAKESSQAAQDQSAKDMAQMIDVAGKTARNELTPNAVATGIALRLGPKTIPLVGTTNETLVKAAKAGSKIPVVGVGGKALNEAFNPARAADKRVYLANRIMTHAGTSFTERDMALVDRALEGVSASNQRMINEVFQIAAFKPLIKGADPESWAKQIDDLTEESAAAKAMLLFRQGDMTKTAIAKENKRIKNIDDAIESLKEMDKRWSTMSSSAKESYKLIRGWYDDKLVKAKAFGLLDKASSQANYVYSKRLAKGERANRRAATAGSPTTDAAFMQQKVTDGLPDDYDVFEWARAYSRDFNRAVFGREFTRMVAFEFGLPRSVTNAMENAKDYVKYEKGSKLLGSPVYLPREIHDSVERLVEFGTDPNEGTLVRLFNDLSSRWKAAAYSNNFGHFLTDSIGDTWNTLIQHGTKIMPHMFSAMQKDGPLWITEQFLKALDEGASFEDTIIIRGQEMKLRDVAKMKVSVGIRNKNEYEVQDLAFGYLDAGNRNTGKAAGDVGARTNTPKSNRQRTIEINGTDVPAPKMLRWYTTKMQRAGNRRDNFSKRLAFVAALSLEASRGKSAALAAREASMAVRRSIFDYSELSAFEKKTARNFIPFYTWTRKNVPYQIRMLAERPVITQAPLRLQSNLEDPNQPDYNVPDYVRAKSLRVGQLPGPIAKLLGQKKGQDFYFNPMLPGFDLNFLQNQRGGLEPSQLLGMVSPTVRVPLELSSSKPANLQYGSELTGPYVGPNGGLPVLGPKGEYVFENAFGQPGRVVSRLFDKQRPKSERYLPLIGSQTGIRGQIVDPVKSRKQVEGEIQKQNQDYLRMLQDAGLAKTSDQLNPPRRKRRKLPRIGSGL